MLSGTLSQCSKCSGPGSRKTQREAQSRRGCKVGSFSDSLGTKDGRLRPVRSVAKRKLCRAL
eukprot:4868527-Amphidinium_carterae.1